MCGVIAVGGRARPRRVRPPGGGRRRRPGPSSRRPPGRAEPHPSRGCPRHRDGESGGGSSCPDESGQSEQGMVTAETALSLPAVVLVLLIVLAAVSAGFTQLRVADAARTAARQAAIGQDDYTGAAQRVAGGVSLGVEQGELTCVTAARPVPGPLGGLGLTARARACTYTEPSSP